MRVSGEEKKGDRLREQDRENSKRKHGQFDVRRLSLRRLRKGETLDESKNS